MLQFFYKRVLSNLNNRAKQVTLIQDIIHMIDDVVDKMQPEIKTMPPGLHLTQEHECGARQSQSKFGTALTHYNSLGYLE
jgi:hypothetical protein